VVRKPEAAPKGFPFDTKKKTRHQFVTKNRLF